MEEFIFGTLATDALKLVHHRAVRSGVQHGYALEPRDPLPGQAVTLSVRTGPDLDAGQVACYYTLDGSLPRGGRGVAEHGHALPLERQAVAWDTLLWGYVTAWAATFPAQPEGAVLRYRIGAWQGDGAEVFADWPHAQDTAERAAAAFFRGEPLPEALPPAPGAGDTFTLRFDRLSPPDWARQAVIYQIFPDRFFPGAGRDWLQTDDLMGFCGGTLWGVAEQMDYVADLGATCIWLTPVFASSSHHGYDATDYYAVEPRLGGDDALRAVIAAAHERGIRVLLDLACNHLSNQHPIFQDALNKPGSQYRDWFTFDDSELGYRAFFGVATLPQLNLANLDARAWMIDIARYWLREFDVDGYRLDYAHGPGPSFWADFWAACKAERPDCFCFGEVVDAPDVQLTYYGRLDGVLDFHLGDALRKTFASGQWDEAQLDRFVERHRAYFPDDFLLPTFLDNHDMNRFLFVAGGDKDALKRAAAAQMRLPGPPIIYYGTEVGLSQAGDVGENFGLEVSRVPMLWGEAQDRELLAYYRGLITARRARATGGD